MTQKVLAVPEKVGSMCSRGLGVEVGRVGDDVVDVGEGFVHANMVHFALVVEIVEDDGG